MGQGGREHVGGQAVGQPAPDAFGIREQSATVNRQSQWSHSDGTGENEQESEQWQQAP